MFTACSCDPPPYGLSDLNKIYNFEILLYIVIVYVYYIYCEKQAITQKCMYKIRRMMLSYELYTVIQLMTRYANKNNSLLFLQPLKAKPCPPVDLTSIICDFMGK